MKAHQHDWVSRTDGYEEYCTPAICAICGEYSCLCRVEWELGRQLTNDEFNTFEARGIAGNNHERAKTYAKEENDVHRTEN